VTKGEGPATARTTTQDDELSIMKERLAAMENKIEQLCLVLSLKEEARAMVTSKEISNLQSFRRAIAGGVDTLRAFYRAGGWTPAKGLVDGTAP
jgi:hypothetical protein